MTDIIEEIESRRAKIDSRSSDLTVSGVASWVKDGVVELDPDFQRRDRWDSKRRSQLIESFLMNIPVPPVYLNQEKNAPYTVIDGKQRITAIDQFINKGMQLTELTLLPMLNGHTYQTLPYELKKTLQVEPALRAVIVIPAQFSDLKDALSGEPTVKYEVFERLNTGGVKLEPQELRNVTFRGPLNDLIIKLSNDEFMQNQLKVRPQDESYKKMKDVEYVLRFFALQRGWKNSSREVKSILDDFMRVNSNLKKSELKKLENSYKRMRERAKEIFGVAAFRKWNVKSEEWRDQQNIAMYDAESIALDMLSEEEYELALQRKDVIVNNVKDLFKNDTAFVDAVTKTTGSRAAITLRINTIHSLLIGENDSGE